MRSFLRAAFSLYASAALFRYRVARRLLGQDKAFLGLTERLARMTGYVGIYLRAAVYSKVLRDASPHVQIGCGSHFSKLEATLASHVYIGRGCSLGWVHLERDVMLADQVVIPSGGNTHAVEPGVPPRARDNKYSCVRVGEGTWIGSGAIVLRDVGKYCVIGAGAVVTKPIPDHSVAVGVPAAVIARADSGSDAATHASATSEEQTQV